MPQEEFRAGEILRRLDANQDVDRIGVSRDVEVPAANTRIETVIAPVTRSHAVEVKRKRKDLVKPSKRFGASQDVTTRTARARRISRKGNSSHGSARRDETIGP